MLSKRVTEYESLQHMPNGDWLVYTKEYGRMTFLPEDCVYYDEDTEELETFRTVFVPEGTVENE